MSNDILYLTQKEKDFIFPESLPKHKSIVIIDEEDYGSLNEKYQLVLSLSGMTNKLINKIINKQKEREDE